MRTRRARCRAAGNAYSKNFRFDQWITSRKRRSGSPSRRSGPLIQANGPYSGKHGLHTKGSFPAKVFICRNICPLVQLACAGRISLAEFMARDNWLFLISIAWILALLSTFVLILIP